MGIIQPNIELYLPFESTLPSLGTDASGNGNHGTVYGVTQGVGKIGGAGVFDGVNDYIQLTAPFSFEIGSSITAYIDLLFASIGKNYYILGCSTQPSAGIAYNRGSGEILFYSNSGRYNSYAPPSGYFFMTIIRTSATTYDFYENSVLKFTSTIGTTTMIIDYIGRRHDGRYLKFGFSKLKIFNTALSEQNIRREMIGLNAII